VEAGGRNKKGAGVVREEEGPGGGHHGPRFFAFSGHPRGRATEGEFATNAAGGWGEGHAARNRMTPAHPPLRGCKNSVRMDFASDRARYLLLPRTSRVGELHRVCTVLYVQRLTTHFGVRMRQDRIAYVGYPYAPTSRRAFPGTYCT
jgi:hypothetical protein